MQTGEEFLAELNTWASKRWYEYGVESPGVLYGRLRNKWQPILSARYAWQRVHRGYDDTSLWSLNHALAALTVAGVRYMREEGNGYPGEFVVDYGAEAWAVWDNILSRIGDGFQAWIDADGGFDTAMEQEKFNDAMDLYSQWFSALWD